MKVFHKQFIIAHKLYILVRRLKSETQRAQSYYSKTAMPNIVFTIGI